MKAGYRHFRNIGDPPEHPTDIAHRDEAKRCSAALIKRQLETGQVASWPARVAFLLKHGDRG